MSVSSRPFVIKTPKIGWTTLYTFLGRPGTFSQVSFLSLDGTGNTNTEASDTERKDMV